MKIRTLCVVAKRFVIRVLSILLVSCLKMLRRISEEAWKKAVSSERENEWVRPGRLPEKAYTPNKTIGLEISHHSGFHGDTQNQEWQLIALPDWTKELQPFLMNQLSIHTRRAYESDLKQFFRFLNGRISLDRLAELKVDHVILYRKYLEEGRLTGMPFEKSTINRKLAVVKSFLNWLRSNQMIPENPAQWVKSFPQGQESALKGFSDEEARKMLMLPNRNSRSGVLHSAILHCLLYLGLRKGELIGLRMGDMDQERGIDVIKVRGKGHRVRVLPISSAVKLSLNRYFEACQRDKTKKDSPLFIPTKNPRTGVLEKPLNPHAITYLVVRYAKKAGVMKRISPHSCRATCISNALDKKATHRSVQHLAGWSTPLMIQRYDKRREDLKNSAAFLIDYGSGEGASL